VSGYSFGDKGIKRSDYSCVCAVRPTQTADSDRPAEKSELLEKARYAVASKWGLLESRGLLKHMRRTFDSVKSRGSAIRNDSKMTPKALSGRPRLAIIGPHLEPT